MKVLIVEDTHEIGRLIKEAVLSLESRVEALVVPSAEEALLEAARQPADLLVVDIRLPGISGLELVNKLRQRQPGLKVIVITGLPDENLPELAAEMAVDGFFRKPVEMTPFLRRAAECLGLQFQPAAQRAAAASLPEALAGLRNASGARGVFLLDAGGTILAQDGMLPKPHTAADLFPELAASLTLSPSLQQRLGGGGSLALHWGGSLALALLPVTDGRWLVAALPGGEAALLSPALLPAMLQAALAVEQLPQRADTPASQLDPLEPGDARLAAGFTEENLEALSDLFSGPSALPVDPDAFWEQAAADRARSPGEDAPDAPADGPVLPGE